MSVRRSVAIAFTGQIVINIISFCGSIAIARLLSPREMGIYAIAMATFGVVAIFSTFGTFNYIIKQDDLTPDAINTACTINAWIEVGLAFLLFASGSVAPRYFGEPGLAAVMRWLAIGPLIGIFSFRPTAMLQRNLRFGTVAAINSACMVGSTGITILLAAKGYSYLSPVFGGLASAAIGVAGFAVVAPDQMIFRPSLSSWRPVTSFGAKMLSISGVVLISEKIAEISIGKLLGLSALGVYSRAASIDALFNTQVYGTAAKLIFPQLAAEYRRTGNVRNTYLHSFQLLSALIWPMLLGLAVVAGPAIYIVYGAKWIGAARPLSILLIAQALLLSLAMNWELFVIKARMNTQIRLELGRSTVGVVSLIAGCFVSLAAVAASKVFTAAYAMLVYRRHIERLAEVRFREIAAIWLESAWLSVVAIGPAVVVMQAYRWSHQVPIIALVGAIAGGAGLWAVLLRYLRHPLYSEFVRAVRALRR